MNLRSMPSHFTLKQRLLVTFGTLMVMMTGFSGFMLFEYHQIALGGAEIARRSHDEMTRAMEMQDSLSQIARLASMGEINVSEITHFRRLVTQVRDFSEDPEVDREATEI